MSKKYDGPLRRVRKNKIKSNILSTQISHLEFLIQLYNNVLASPHPLSMMGYFTVYNQRRWKSKTGLPTTNKKNILSTHISHLEFLIQLYNNVFYILLLYKIIPVVIRHLQHLKPSSESASSITTLIDINHFFFQTNHTCSFNTFLLGQICLYKLILTLKSK